MQDSEEEDIGNTAETAHKAGKKSGGEIRSKKTAHAAAARGDNNYNPGAAGRKRSQLQRESGSRGGGSAAPEGDRGKDTVAADHPEVMHLLVHAHFLFLAYTHIHTY
mmetsp:Transcript_81250/g.131667  ORF Transcript_81250/g.131667 Transcript_81250/m.131667 type:complete len:107 (+) Transcript_81250:154-474(+)